MTTLELKVDDGTDVLELDVSSPDPTCVDPVTPSIEWMRCAHCEKEIREIHAPLTCGCVICDCMCPNWHLCPKDTDSEAVVPSTDMKKE